MELLLLLMGWPGILAFLTLATLAVALGRPRLADAALLLSLPSAFYAFAGESWVQAMGLYIPVSLALAGWLLSRNRHRRLIPALLLIPLYLFYIYLGMAVMTQGTG